MSKHNLIIAEKPSVARLIASVLGVDEKKDGYLKGGGYIVSWCIGHLVEMKPADAYDERYAKWRYDDLPIIPQEWKYAVPEGKAAQFGVLKRLLEDKDVDAVVCATDAGREGELIFRLVYGQCGCTKPIKRLWISSMEDAAIKEGFANLKDGMGFDNLYRAALCRAQADWLVGINATRLFSVLYGETLNIGRVMSPTLALLARRENDIASFVKKPFFIPQIDCGAFTASAERTEDKAEAGRTAQAADGKAATVAKVTKQEKAVTPPKLYDLTGLQRDANRLLGFTAQQTLDHLQSLYEKKLATYPRTDSRYLTNDMEDTARGIISAIAEAMPFANGVATPAPDIKRVTDDSKVSDHHAIIPTVAAGADLTALPPGEREVLCMIAARLLAATAEKHTYEQTEATLSCGGGEYSAKGRIVLNDGWKAIDAAYRATLKDAPKDSEGDDAAALPELAEGDVFDPVAASVREGQTSPPKHYTEDTLLSAMETAGAEDMPEDAERKGLGTSATRAATIEKLVKTGFVERNKKQLLPTDKGKNLIAVLPDMLTSPMLTAEWETRLLGVERGESDADSFMDGISDFTRLLVKENDKPDPSFAALFGVGRTGGGAGEQIGICPRCGKPVRERGKGFFCDDRACGFALWKDNRFFTSKKKELTKAVAVALLKDGRMKMKGLYSEKTGKTYDAAVVLNDDGGKYVNFKLEFENGGRKNGK